MMKFEHIAYKLITAAFITYIIGLLDFVLLYFVTR